MSGRPVSRWAVARPGPDGRPLGMLRIEVVPAEAYDRLAAELDEIRTAAARVLGGARSYVSSMPYAAPESLGSQFNRKLSGPLGDLHALVEDDASTEDQT